MTRIKCCGRLNQLKNALTHCFANPEETVIAAVKTQTGINTGKIKSKEKKPSNLSKPVEKLQDQVKGNLIYFLK